MHAQEQEHAQAAATGGLDLGRVEQRQHSRACAQEATCPRHQEKRPSHEGPTASQHTSSAPGTSHTTSTNSERLAPLGANRVPAAPAVAPPARPTVCRRGQRASAAVAASVIRPPPQLRSTASKLCPNLRADAGAEAMGHSWAPATAGWPCNWSGCRGRAGKVRLGGLVPATAGVRGSLAGRSNRAASPPPTAAPVDKEGHRFVATGPAAGQQRLAQRRCCRPGMKWGGHTSTRVAPLVPVLPAAQSAGEH